MIISARTWNEHRFHIKDDVSRCPGSERSKHKNYVQYRASSNFRTFLERSL